MRRLPLKSAALAFGAAMALCAVQARATEVNVIPGHTSSAGTDGTAGVLHSATWQSGSAPSDETTPHDGVFAPESQQWNNGSFWWDEDPSVNDAPVHYFLTLDQAFTFTHFIVQADDNDTYELDWWDGAAWQVAWSIPTAGSFGLTTRDSGIVAPIMTDRFRFFATSGDNYYGVSEIQAFANVIETGGGVPEPATWGLMIAGFGLAGLALRRRAALA